MCFELSIPDVKYNLVCSAAELEMVFEKECVGHYLRSILVDINGYAYMDAYDNVYDFTDMGGQLLIALDDKTISLIIHGEGLFDYRILPEINEMVKSTIEYGELDELDDRWRYHNSLFYDLAKQWRVDNGFPILEIGIERCKVEYCRWPCRSSKRFDKDQLREGAQLPKSIRLYLDDKIWFDFIGDSIEFFYITVSNVNDSRK